MSKDSRQSESNDSTYKARALEQAAQPAAESEQIDALALQRAVDGPGFTAPNDILNLQRAAGNRAVSRLIQTKLTVGPAGDKYEQEADAVAEKVLRMPERPPSIDSRPPIDDGIRRSAVDGRRSDGDGSFQPGQVFERSLSSGSSGSPLPGSVRNYMEPRFGADFSNVRVHTDSRAEQLNNRIQAQAFTRGSDVFFGAGKYNPGTTAGNHLLAHELTHVVQQGAAHAPHRRASRFPIARARIQRWGKSEQQKQDELKQNKDELTALKRDIYFKLEDGAWPEAIAGIKKHNIQYSKSGWWGGTRLAKWFRDTLNLNPLRQKAKALIPNKDTKPSDEVLKSVSDIARDTRSAAKSDTLTTGNLSNHPHILGTVKKIGHYLVSSIPTSVMGFVKSFSDTDLDLATELGASVDRGAPRTGAPSTRVNTDVQDLKNSLSTGVIEGRGFHGSASWLLEGLGKSSGKLLSQKSAFEAGLLKTGEGTTFSSGAGLKTNVYIGKGETGFGTAASYALAPASLTSYNVSLFSDQELASEIDRHNKVLQLEQILSLMNPTIVGSGRGVTMAQIKEAAINAGLDVSDPGYARMFGLQTSLQLKDMLSKLLKEQQARKTWDVNDPRRQGGQVNPDNYPILLEFDLTGLTVTEDFGGKQREAKGDYRLAGEATVSDEIDLTSGRLKVVYCPEQFIGRTDTKLKAVFGDTHGVTIRALESIRGAITKDSKADKTISATYGQLEKQQKSLDVKMKAHSDLASGLSIPTEFVGKGGQKFEQRRTAGGGSGYVATDLSKSMSANPAFEAAALAFEQRLGAYAFAHTKANAAAKSIADKIVAYLDERKRLVETLETGTQEAFSGADAYGKVGELNKRIAGAVGKNIDDIKAVFTSGNLRERMTHTYNFATRVLHADLELNDQQDTVKQILSTVDIDEDEARGVKEIPVDDVMGQRDETRASSGRGTFGESTVKSLADLGLGLSAREKTHLSANKDTAKVGWNEGARMWFMNEANEWVQAQRELSIPLMAGPSSHTNTIMRTAKALKVGNLDHVRLALIGHLVPIRAHSLVEILVAAKPFGVPFTKGVEMYKKIDPLPESELRANVAENDKFPGET